MKTDRLIIGLVLAVSLYGQFSPGPLVAVHSDLSGATHCGNCHDFDDPSAMRDRCLDCHTPVRTLVQEKRGFHGLTEEKSCEGCHPDHLGTKNLNVKRWKREAGAFDHSSTGYILDGKHAGLDCRKCHTEKNISQEHEIRSWVKEKKIDADAFYGKTWLGLGRDCSSCHGDPHAPVLGKDCARCHVTASWQQASEDLDHDSTAYPLTGRHRDVTCDKCHPSAENKDRPALRIFRGVEFRDCSPCHADVHKGQFDRTCGSCHETSAWNSARRRFDHNDSRFKLKGKHRDTDCAKCHPAMADPLYKDARLYRPLESIRCAACHEDFHKGKLGTICENCHVETSWRETRRERFDHDQTGFRLKGAHGSVDCEKCHKPGEAKYRPIHEKCLDCHEDEHRGDFAGDPWNMRCEPCHTEARWIPADYGFREHAQSDFPLTGAHRATPCTDCHKKDREHVFSGFSTVCSDCHKSPHPGSFARYGGCESCHNAYSWKTENMDHDRTGFPLQGKHRETDCQSCHEGLKHSGSGVSDLSVKGKRCEDCHADIHAGQFRLAGNASFCERCHDPGQWEIAAFDHGRLTRWPLDGSHKNVACGKCHVPAKNRDGQWFVKYSGTSEKCEDCHKVK